MTSRHTAYSNCTALIDSLRLETMEYCTTQGLQQTLPFLSFIRKTDLCFIYICRNCRSKYLLPFSECVLWFLIASHSFDGMSNSFSISARLYKSCENWSGQYHKCCAGQVVYGTYICMYSSSSSNWTFREELQSLPNKTRKSQEKRPKKHKQLWLNFRLLAHYLNNLTMYFIDVTLPPSLFQHFALCFIIAGV